MIDVEVLVVEDCPNAGVAFERVQAALSALGASATVRSTEIFSTEQALEQRFCGSPTVRVNGEDVEPDARNRTHFGVMCRTYRTTGAVTEGAPSVDCITAAIARVRAGADPT